jgi:hypothetical protein
MKIFLAKIPLMHKLSDQVVEGRDNPHDYYAQSRDEITECLSHAIVPSTIIHDGKPVWAHPTAVINTAMFYWLDGMSDIFKLVDGADASDVGHRAFYESRLEMWAMKAVEDWLTMHDRKGGLAWPS